MPTRRGAKPKVLKQFAQLWLFEGLERDPSYLERRMFGGLAIYLHGRMVAMLAESDDEDRTWRGKRYPFAIWNGILWPMARESHEKVLKRYPTLISHPVLPKWLYLPLKDPDYEVIASRMVRQIQSGDLLFGIEPKTRSQKTRKSRRKRSR